MRHSALGRTTKPPPVGFRGHEVEMWGQELWAQLWTSASLQRMPGPDAPQLAPLHCGGSAESKR